MRKDGVFVEVVLPRPLSIRQGRAQEANLITAWLAATCGLAGVCGMFPVIEWAVSAFFAVIVVLVVLVILLRWLVRRSREHVEDREDALAAERWRMARTRAGREGSDRGAWCAEPSPAA